MEYYPVFLIIRIPDKIKIRIWIIWIIPNMNYPDFSGSDTIRISALKVTFWELLFGISLDYYFLLFQNTKFSQGPRERKWSIMAPIKNQKRGVFGLNIKFSICRGYTKIFLKISPCGRGERKCEFLPVFWTISLKNL